MPRLGHNSTPHRSTEVRSVRASLSIYNLLYYTESMIRSRLKQVIAEALRAEFGDVTIPEFSLEVPENPAHGDYATNAALIMAKEIRREAKDVVRVLAERLREVDRDLIANAESAGAGFVNLWLADAEKEVGLGKILADGERYGDAAARSERLQVEFISANPTGPLTLANGRGGFFGDVLSNVLASQGYQVEREYYTNDAGNQIHTLGQSLRAAAGLITDAEEYYHGDYLTEWAKTHPEAFARGKDDPEALGRLAAADFLATLIKPAVGEKMKIRFDRWTSEYADIRQKGYAEKILQLAKQREFIYEADGATWLKTTAFGDDKDRVLVTGDGLPTYFFVDAGHYFETKGRGFSRKINIVGADHHGYVSRIQAVAKLIGLESVMVVMQLVRLLEGGKEVRMSKRMGVYVTINELIDEVGLDAVRYFFLEKNPETHVDFDLALATQRSKENPVYYIQYAHARLSSLRRKGMAAPQTFDFAALDSTKEQSLIRQLLQFPEILEDIGRDYRVSRLVRYTYTLSHAFHLFYEGSRILDAEGPARDARMALAAATDIVLKKSLSLLGIAAPEEM